MSAEVGRAEGLTQREAEVFSLLLEGKADKEIASLLGVAVRTVRHHVGNIFAKTRVAGRARLIAVALKRYPAQLGA